VNPADPQPPVPPPPFRVRLALNCYKITKPIERISLEWNVLRDCVTPPQGWRGLKAVPRAKRLEEYRERWAVVDQFLVDKWNDSMLIRRNVFKRALEAKERGEPPREPLDPEVFDGIRKSVLRTITHGIFHPHDAARRWYWSKNKIDPDYFR
jgi:hypothetical protein